MNKSKLFEDIAKIIDSHIHTESNRQILSSILAQTVELANENEILEKALLEQDLEIARLRVYERFYDNTVERERYRCKNERA